MGYGAEPIEERRGEVERRDVDNKDGGERRSRRRHRDGDDGGDAIHRRGRSSSRSHSRSRSLIKRKRRSRDDHSDDDDDDDDDSRSTSTRRKKKKHKHRHIKKKHKHKHSKKRDKNTQKHKRHRRSSSSRSVSESGGDSSDSDSGSEEVGWEKQFLATAMENAQKSRMGMSDPTGGLLSPGLGVPGIVLDPLCQSGASAAPLRLGRFFDNQGRFINPAGGFNPSGAPRRIPKEHGQWGDWECESCGGHNRKHRHTCFTCFVPKPVETKEAVYTTSIGGRIKKHAAEVPS